MDQAEADGAVKSANRVLDLFELLGRWDREMMHGEIASALSIPKSSLTLLLRNLIARGYVEFSDRSKGYRLGHAFPKLARNSGAHIDLARYAEPVLNEIVETVEESSALMRLRGHQAEVVATVLGPQRLVSHMRVGDMSPLYATSGGKIILAHLSEELQQEYLDAVRFEAITDKTIRSADALRREMDVILRDGLAYSFEEYTPGIVAIAAVILSTTGYPLGALNVMMPAVRSKREVLERTGRVLRRAAQELTRQVVQASSFEAQGSLLGNGAHKGRAL